MLCFRIKIAMLKFSSSENTGRALPEVGSGGDCTEAAEASNSSVWLPTLERLRWRLPPPDRID